MPSQRKTIDIGRNAETGRFTTVDKALQSKKDHVVERLPKPGFGQR